MRTLSLKAYSTNVLKKIILFVVFFAFLQECFASQTFISVKSGKWSDPTTWGAKGNEPYPGQFDNVTIKSGHIIILDVNTYLTRNFIIEAGATLRGDGTGKSLVIGKDKKEDDLANYGTIDFASPYTAVIKLEQASEWTGDGTYNLSTLNLNNSALTFSPGSEMTLNFSGATPITNFGSVTSLPGIHFNFNGTVPQTLPPLNITYGSIEINNPAGVTLGANINAGNLLGDLTITSGTLNANNFTITGSPGSTLTVTAGAVLNLSGSTSVPFPSGFSNYNLEPGSVVNYSAAAYQEIAPIQYSNLVISGFKGGNITTFSAWPTPTQPRCTNLTLESESNFILNRNLTVDGTLSLTGILTVGSNTLTLNGGPVQGNTANFKTTAASSLVLGGSSSGVTIPSGVGALKRLIINNSSATGINLLASLTLHGKLGFVQGKLHLNLNNLTVQNADSIVGADATKYVVTNNNPTAGGFLIAPVINNTLSHKFPVGTATSYAPAIIKLTTGSVPDAFRVRVFDQVLTNGTTGAVISKYVVNKTWLIEETVVGGSNASLRLGWLEQDQATGFDPAQTGTSHYTNGKWEHATAWASSVSGGGCLWQERSGFTSFSPFTVVDKNLVDVVVNLKLFLQGPYSATTGLMNTNLNTLGLLPLNQPYSDVPWNYAGTESVASGFFAANPTIVDWILLEFRTGTAANTAIARKAALLKSNGEIVDTDGVSIPVLRDVASGNYYVVLIHRTHLPIMSKNTITINSSSNAIDFTNVDKIFGSGATLLNGTIYGLTNGDINADGQINATDRANTWNNKNKSGYSINDINLDGQINASDRAGTWNNRNKTKSF